MIIAPSATSLASPPAPIQGAQALHVRARADAQGDGDGGRRAQKNQGGGQMQQAMMQALQTLGLSLTPQTAAAGSVQPTSATADAVGSASASNNTRNDLRQFMHALFQAVKDGASSSAMSSTMPGLIASPGIGDPKASFSSGLSTLITQVSQGTAPKDLQAAFSQLMSDLVPTGAAEVSANGSTGAKMASSAYSKASLQSLLSTVQQNLGYGSLSFASTANIVSTTA